MRLCKIGYRDTHGQKREIAKWYFEVRDRNGVVRRLPGFADRAATEELGRKVERLLALHEAGRALDPTLRAWVERLSPRLRKSLARIEAIDPRPVATSRPIAVLCEEFRRSLQARERSPKHVALVIARAKRVLELAGVSFWSELDALGVERALTTLRRDGLSAQSINHHLVSVRSLVRWMIANGIAAEDPLRVLRPLNVRLDRKRVRRALEPDELRALLRATAAGPERQHLSGPERALLYRMAVETGLRANELRSLRTASLHGLDADEPSVTLQAAASKRRREDTLPLGLDLARELATHVQGRPGWEPVFGLLKSWRPCNLLREDLALAKIDESDEEDQVVDFHSLRVTFISGLARSGISPKVVQTLARHSTPLLTYERYVKIGRNDERRALDVLPDLAGCTTAPRCATGTADT